MSEAGGFLFFHFYYPPAGQSGEYFRWKEIILCFCSALYDIGRIMYHGRKEQKTDAKTRYRRQYVKNVQKQTDHENQKTTNEDKAAI